MFKIQYENKYYFFNLLAFLIASSLFVVGRFGFFDILGLKRLFEVIFLLPIVLLGVPLILQISKTWVHPFFLLPLTYLLFQIFLNHNRLEIADLSLATLIVGIVLSLGIDFSDLLIRYLIKIATFFACLGLIEFCILLIEPSLVKHILLFYDSYSASTTLVIDNFLQLLGLSDGTSYHLWGMAVTRLRSFASEPSLLVGYFLVPGALGLTYGGKNAFYGIICIAFCVCSLAGSVYVSLFFSGLSLFFLFTRSHRFITIVPFIIYAIFLWFLYNHFMDLILFSKNTSQGYDFLDKTNSANVRFSYIRDFIPNIITSPFGFDEELHQPLGFIIRSFASGGIFGGILAFIVITKLYKKIAYLLLQKQLNAIRKMGLLITYGSLICGLLYLDNCFIQIYGFTLITLIYMRLSKLSLLRH